MDMIVMLPNERTLVSRAASEPAAFAAIYDHYFPRVYNYVRYRVVDATTADDLTAEVFERVLRNIHTFHPERAVFGAWLFAIVRHTITDHFRSQKKRRWFSLDSVQEKPSELPLPEDLVTQNDVKQALLAAVQRLEDRERDIIALKYASGLSYQEIGALLRLSESNVGVILHRAMSKLRTILSGADHE